MSKQGKFSASTAMAIVIANMIGTGIFTSLGFQLADIRSGFVIMLLWVLGGIVALCGALCYAELGTKLPRSGGEYNFLNEIYHPAAGFISGWISATVGFAAPTALAAITFGTYLSSVFPSLDPLWLATILVVSMTWIHATTHKNSGGLQSFFTVAKILLIIGFSIAALLSVDNLQNITYMPSETDIPIITGGAFAVSLIYVSYAYTGWNAATYLTGELDRPKKTLPYILAIGTGTVMLSYLLLNYVFLAVAPMDAMAGKLEIGYVAATHAFGEMGANIMGVSLALLLISTVSAMLVAAPRVLQVLGEDYSLFKFLSKRNRHNIPSTAIWFQSTMTLIFLWTASFQSILIFSGATMAINSLLVIFGVFVLRQREALDESHIHNKEDFQIPLFPLPPIIFIFITTWTLIYLAMENPIEIAFSAGVIITGALGYFLTRKLSL
ncbi:MAG: amino acid permease [Kordiimonadaceae bacterium]|jgi:basic amino acid/polyamine antiporter, APA family|nr:amino acid permease [Kordiimonadaceae bacterium]MBT6032234.1 amino acid permease [Kordiimonadaceae bacterium]